MCNISDRAVGESQQVAGIEQAQTVEIVERRAAGLLLHLPVQGAQRHRKLFSQHRPVDLAVADLHAHEVATVDPDLPLDELTAIFGRNQAAVVVKDGAVVGIVTKIDVIDFLASGR